MNPKGTLRSGTIVLALAAACAAAMAQQQPSTDIVVGALDGHAFRNGGISAEQVAEMHQDLKSYDLQLTLSEGPHKAYAGGVKLTISDAAGDKVFSLDDAGPLVDVNLAPGHYRVLADFGRTKRLATVDVAPEALSTLYLHASHATP